MKAVLKGIGALILALVVWFVVATVVDRIVRAGWPAYAAVERQLNFSLPMEIYRLALGAASTLVAAVAAPRLSKAPWLPAALGCALILLFLPEHVKIWNRLPVWYHLTFLGYLIPVSLVGARLSGVKSA